MPTIGHDQRRRALPCDDLGTATHFGRQVATDADQVTLDRIQRALADLPPPHIDAAHACLRSERHELHVVLLQVAFAQAEFFLGKHHDTATFRRFIGERCQLRRVGKYFDRNTRCRMERHGLAVAERDRAGFIEQQHIDVARRLDRAPGRGDHVRLDHAIHARDTDGREQAADRGRNQADQQRDENRDRDRLAAPRGLNAVQRIRQQGDAGKQENQREFSEQNRQRDFVRRLASRGAFDHRDHAIEKTFAGIIGDAHHQPVRQYARAAGDRTAITAGFANHRRGFAGDRAFVDRRRAFDHFAIAGNLFVGLHQHQIATAQIASRGGCDRTIAIRRRQFVGQHIATRAAQCLRLRLAATFGQRLGKVRKQQGEPQPQTHPQNKSGRCFAVAEQCLQPQAGSHHAADKNHEHHRIAELALRCKFAQRFEQGRDE